MPKTAPPIAHPSPDLATVSEAQWTEAKRREALIRPLSALGICPVTQAEAAAQELGVSSRRIYTLIHDYRASGGLLTSLIPDRSKGGKGKSRLSGAVKEIICEAIDDIYLNRQKAPVSRVVEEVRRRCLRAKLKPPWPNKSEAATKRHLYTIS